MKPEVVFGLENSAWPALLVNGSGKVLRANAAAQAVFGPAVGGETSPLALIWSAENGRTDVEYLTRWEQAPAAVSELKFRTANGSTVSFNVATCTFKNEGSKWFVLQLLPPMGGGAPPVSAPIIFAPVSPATKPPVDAEGVTLRQKLDCALQLARTVSLDFNNALTSILGHTSLLLGKTDPGHPWRHSLIEVEKSAARAAEIAGELQTFSRQEKETRRQPPGNLSAVVNRCVDFFRNAPGSKINWKVQAESDLFGARFDEAKVQQALTKILENAAEAAATVSNGQISVQTRNLDLTEPTQDRNVRLAAGAYVCVEIVDNGPGIAEDVLPRIFEPFFTTKGKAHRGLGLALVYGIISNHGGGVVVTGQPGKGASARFYLPAEKQLLRNSPDGAENLHGAETILVVDDEPLLLTMAETILTEFGYKVLTANGGQKALAMLARDDTHVDLLLTDMVMPGISGRELVERVRQLAPKTRILFNSGYLMPADRQAGAAFLQKPFTSADLLRKVRQVLSGQQG